ncbi:hypothetical protein VC116063_001719 [Vibrio cholerae O1 str. 116063]|nr:hypothetical protein VIF_003111 [Vibrio cholerae TM 11079-80]EMP86241.1 hypothetical protein VC116063_001719 [Vibrio cholerae O1 str. 116063]
MTKFTMPLHSYLTDHEGTNFGSKGDSDFVMGIQVEAWW